MLKEIEKKSKKIPQCILHCGSKKYSLFSCFNFLLTILLLLILIVVEIERNSYYLHEVAIQEKEDNTLFKTGTVKNGTSGKVLSSPIFTLLQKLQSVKNESEDNTEYQGLMKRLI